MVYIEHNGVELTNYILSAPYSDTLDDELDKANFQIKSTNRITFNKNDKIYYEIKTGQDVVIEKNMCLFDWVESYENEYWLYQLTLLSPTKLLEGFIINGMASTTGSTPRDLLTQFIDVVQKIQDQLDMEVGGNIGSSTTHNVIFHFNGGSAIGKTNMEAKAENDFLWDGQMTVREILQDICDKADCLVIATDYEISNGKISDITLDIIPREWKRARRINTNNDIESGGLNAIGSVVKGITIHRDSNFNNGNLISLTKNAICKDNIQQTYLPARNDDLTIDDEAEWHILTQEPIYSLNSVKFLANIDVIMDVDNEGTAHDYTFSQAGILQLTAEFDITDYIVEKDVFDVLPLSTQKKRLYFKRGEKGIYGLFNRYKKNPLQSNTAMQNIVIDLNANMPTGPIRFNNVAPSQFGCYDSDYKTFTPATELTSILNNQTFQTYGSISDIIPSNFTYGKPYSAITYSTKFLFSVNYQPYCDSVVKIEKSNVVGNVKNLSTIKNQSDRTIDASKYYDSQISLCNRLGNDEMTLDVIIDSTLDISEAGVKRLWNLGDYITMASHNWTLTKRELETYSNDKIKARYYLSKDYNASNSAININRDKRLYGIPLSNFVDRYILIETFAGTNTNLQNLKKVLVKCTDDFTGDGTSQQGYCVMDCIKIGNATKYNKVVKFKDNYAVDIERTKYSSTIVNVNLRYGNADGTASTIEIKGLTYDYMYNGIDISDYSRLPFIRTIDVIDSAYYSNFINYTLNNLHKDKMERLILVFK